MEAVINCVQCGAVCPPAPASGGASGYAIRQDGQKICYQCADTVEREALKQGDKALVYVGGTSHKGQVTTWTGGKLGDILHTQYTTIFGKRGYAYTIRDIHGQLWHGKHAGMRAGPGMALKLKRKA